jgi:hypothetical protein
VSVLTRVFGWRHFDRVEDIVQATLLLDRRLAQVCRRAATPRRQPL